MTKTKVICIMLCSAILFVGCAAESIVENQAVTIEDNVVSDSFNLGAGKAKDIEDNHIYIVTDHATGVQYVVYRERANGVGYSGITPRLNADGSLYVANTDEETTNEVSENDEG